MGELRRMLVELVEVVEAMAEMDMDMDVPEHLGREADAPLFNSSYENAIPDIWTF